MNFFSRHKKILVKYATIPAIILVLMAACFVFFRPAQVSAPMFLNYFFSSPLGMGLELVVLLSMMIYQTYRRLNPATPKHRAYFVAGALCAGIIVAGLYSARLSRTIAFLSASSAEQFLALALVFYCVYRLVILMPERMRQWTTCLFALGLSFHLISAGMAVYKRVSPGFPCVAGTKPDLWQVIVYKDPWEHCAAR